MKHLLALVLLAITAITAITVRAADPADASLTGHYELTKKSSAALSLDVQQKGKTATASLSTGVAQALDAYFISAARRE